MGLIMVMTEAGLAADVQENSTRRPARNVKKSAKFRSSQAADRPVYCKDCFSKRKDGGR